jgi:hypothetical protein
MISFKSTFSSTSGNGYGEKLTKKLSPEEGPASSVLADFSDFSALKKVSNIPPTRFKEGFAEDDIALQIEVQKLIDSGDINKHSFIVSDTGHDIPILAQLLKNHSLNVQGSFHYSDEIDETSLKRIASQTRTWGNEIEQNNKKKHTKTGALFIGLEAHREDYFHHFLYKIDSSTLPTPDELKKLGIENVVYLTEDSPDATYSLFKAKDDIRDYLKHLEKAGFITECKGIDPRDPNFEIPKNYHYIPNIQQTIDS